MRVGDPPVGGRYSLVEPFGADERFAGGKVQTWRAHDDVVDRPVVLRIMTPGGNAAKLFLDRALEMSMIAHPGLGMVYEAVDHGDYAVVVSEWIEGTSLARTLQEHGPLTPKTARQTLGNLAEAITVAHHAGLPIGGLTAERVVLRDDASVTVTGVPALFADERGDIQQLGRLLFAALTGAEPASDDAEPFTKLGREVPRELAVLCQRALDDDPSRQLGSAAAFAAVLSPKTKPVSPSGETAGRTGERLGGLDAVPEPPAHDTAPAEFAVVGQRGRADAAEPRVVGQIPAPVQGRGTEPTTDRIPVGNGDSAGAARGRGPTTNGRGPAAKSQGPAAKSQGPAAKSQGPAAKSQGPAAKNPKPTTTQAIPTAEPPSAAKATPTPIGEPKPAGRPRSPTRPSSGSGMTSTTRAARPDASAGAAADTTGGAASAAASGAAVPSTQSIPITPAPAPTQAIPIGPSAAGPSAAGPTSTPTTQEIPTGQAGAAPEPAAPTQAISIPTRPSTEDSAAAARPNDTRGAFRADVRADWAEPPPDRRTGSPIRTAEDYDPWLDDTGGWGNDEEDQDDDDYPYEGGQTRRKVLLYAVPLSALILVVVLAVLVGKQFSAALPDGGPAVLPPSESVAPTEDPGESAPSDTAAPIAAALPIVSAAVFDPFGDGQPENDGDVGLTYDGDVASAWATLTYQSTPEFGNLKPGVGVIYDLGAEHSISSIELVTNLPGTAVEVRVGAAPDAPLESYPVVGAVDPFTDNAAVQLAEPVRARFVIVWFVRLVESNGGFKGTLSECRILGV